MVRVGQAGSFSRENPCQPLLQAPWPVDASLPLSHLTVSSPSLRLWGVDLGPTLIQQDFL